MTARTWLTDNKYDDVIKLMDRVEKIWKANGVTTRRNWWEALAGDRNGQPRVVQGLEFPVLAAAQEHEGMPVTANAIRRNPREVPPSKDFRGQWYRRATGKKGKARAK